MCEVPPNCHALPWLRAFAHAFALLTHTASSLHLLNFLFTPFGLNLTSCGKLFQVPHPLLKSESMLFLLAPTALYASLVRAQITLHCILLSHPAPIMSVLHMMTGSLRAGAHLGPCSWQEWYRYSLDEKRKEVWAFLQTPLREKMWEEDQNEHINRNSLPSYVRLPQASLSLVENVFTLNVNTNQGKGCSSPIYSEL